MRLHITTAAPDVIVAIDATGVALDVPRSDLTLAAIPKIVGAAIYRARVGVSVGVSVDVCGSSGLEAREIGNGKR